MGLSASQLDRRIQVLRFTNTGKNPYGEQTGDWQELGKPVFARRRDMSDVERLSAGAWDNVLVTRFVIRASRFGRGIRRSDQLRHDGMIFEISGIKECPEGRGFLEITASTSEPK